MYTSHLKAKSLWEKTWPRTPERWENMFWSCRKSVGWKISALPVRRCGNMRHHEYCMHFAHMCGVHYMYLYMFRCFIDMSGVYCICVAYITRICICFIDMSGVYCTCLVDTSCVYCRCYVQHKNSRISRAFCSILWNILYILVNVAYISVVPRQIIKFMSHITTAREKHSRELQIGCESWVYAHIYESHDNLWVM